MLIRIVSQKGRQDVCGKSKSIEFTAVMILVKQQEYQSEDQYLS